MLENFTKKFWKRSGIIIPVIFIVFFLIGFVREYSYYERWKERIEAEKKSSLQILTEYHESFLQQHGNLSAGYIIKNSAMTGAVQGIVYTALVLYVVVLLTFMVSKNEKLRKLGSILLMISLAFVLMWLWFTRNFHFEF